MNYFKGFKIHLKKASSSIFVTILEETFPTTNLFTTRLVQKP